jgi:hypothetical protein
VFRLHRPRDEVKVLTKEENLVQVKKRWVWRANARLREVQQAIDATATSRKRRISGALKIDSVAHGWCATEIWPQK